MARGRSEIGGLDYELHLKETAKVMPTANIDISDRLINIQIGTANSQDICHFKQPKAINKHKHVRANPKVQDYERLRNVVAIIICDQQMNQSDPTLLVISLLNIRSLNKHSIDINYDSSICNSDMTSFTEKQPLPNSNDNQITENLQSFTLLRQDHVSHRFSRIVLCAIL